VSRRPSPPAARHDILRVSLSLSFSLSLFYILGVVLAMCTDDILRVSILRYVSPSFAPTSVGFLRCLYVSFFMVPHRLAVLRLELGMASYTSLAFSPFYILGIVLNNVYR